MEISKELWVDIYEYEGLYQVSNMGRVRSCARIAKTKRGYRRYREKILSGSKNSYVTMTLFKDGVGTNFLLHRLVAHAFIPNPKGLPEVNHKDNNPMNNVWTNLEWVSSAENTEYRILYGKKSKSYRRKVTCLETGEEFPSISKAGASVSASTQQVIDSIKAKHCCKGFTFVYSDDIPEDVESYLAEAHRSYQKYHYRPSMPNSKKIREVETGRIFDSIMAASREYGCDSGTIVNRIKAAKPFNGITLEFVDPNNEESL